MAEKSSRYVPTVEETPIDTSLKPEDGWKMAIRWLVHEKNRGAQFGTVGYAVFPPSTGAHDLHYHENAEEFTYYLRGRGLRTVGDEQIEVKAGDFGYVPAGVPHGMRNLSDTEPIELICVYMGAPSVEKAGYTRVKKES